jgi:hypothetical protein
MSELGGSSAWVSAPAQRAEVAPIPQAIANQRSLYELRPAQFSDADRMGAPQGVARIHYLATFVANVAK